MDTELNCHCVYVDFLGLQFHSMIRRCVFGKNSNQNVQTRKLLKGWRRTTKEIRCDLEVCVCVCVELSTIKDRDSTAFYPLSAFT